MGADVGNLAGVIQDLQTSIDVPATAVQGSTVTASIAPVPTSVPSSDSGVAVNYAAPVLGGPPRAEGLHLRARHDQGDRR